MDSKSNIVNLINYLGTFDIRTENYVMISYSSNDKEVAWDKCYEWACHFGIPLWLDLNLNPGEDWFRFQVQQAIRNCSLFAIFVSSNSLQSEAVLRELCCALDERRTILPIYIESKEKLQRIKNIDFREIISKHCENAIKQNICEEQIQKFISMDHIGVCGEDRDSIKKIRDACTREAIAWNGFPRTIDAFKYNVATLINCGQTAIGIISGHVKKLDHRFELLKIVDIDGNFTEVPAIKLTSTQDINTKVVKEESEVYPNSELLTFLKVVLRKNIGIGYVYTYQGIRNEADFTVLELGIEPYDCVLSHCDIFFYTLISLLTKNSITGELNLLKNWSWVSQLDFFKNWELRLSGILSNIATPCIGMGISVAILFKCIDDKGDIHYKCLAHKKNFETNAIEPYHIFPAGMYEPGRRTIDYQDDSSIYLNAIRETAEELFGIKECENPANNRFVFNKIEQHSDDYRHINRFVELIENKEAEFKIFGISMDVLRLRPELMTTIIINNTEYYTNNKRYLTPNEETDRAKVLEFKKGLSFKKTLQNGGILNEDETLLQLPFRFVPTGLNTLYEAFLWVQNEVTHE